ncbi:PREDICTED: indole glucosinolate O-methyltransferase 4-like isoform X1 [Camelina sativa]|uniref:Indole glucosinolate O-methyltransferase 4-like isoform X1 n=1 Tax=Camelina sativa TaxID=90675 RepID=A0ABM0SZC6_CAMSA|nr:PREDICTED: indole glucosinolate O-methyltransferase 4-like isoform X1 [Camelina sativa]
MANHPQDPLTTSSELALIKEDQQFDKETVSLQADKILYTMAFPMAFKTALELGVFDTIAAVDEGMWLSSSEIALRLPTKPTNPEAPVLLDRMLALLVSHSILKCRMVETGKNGQTRRPERVYAAEPVCMFFLNRGGGSGSLASLFMVASSEVYFKTWEHLKDMILEGTDAFTSAHGMKLFEYIDTNERFGEIFNRAMSDASINIMNRVLEVYKGFEDVKTLVDVGGGVGTSIGLVTSKYPHIKGINFDIAKVISHAPLYPGVEHVSGDMFKEIPKGDAIFMKWILHDWNDEDCVKILKSCWASLSEKGKVILVDMITPVEPKINDSSNIVFAVDMVMLTLCSGGKERSLPQIETLAFDSGFIRCDIICHAYSYSLIELHK